VCKRELEIRNFVPVTYFEIVATAKVTRSIISSISGIASTFGANCGSMRTTSACTVLSWRRPLRRSNARGLSDVSANLPKNEIRGFADTGKRASARHAGHRRGAVWRGGFAHLLKNRFYIGESVYRGEVPGGEQAPGSCPV
jgi:hypothetical protein